MHKKIFLLIGTFCLGLLLLNWTAGAEQRQHQPELWAAISVSAPMFDEGWTKDLSIRFTLVNDGSELINPKIEASRIIINGRELENSSLIFGNGPRDARWSALPPGDNLSVAYALEQHFKDPGIYRVSWKGEGFEAPAVIFRVMPRKDTRK